MRATLPSFPCRTLPVAAALALVLNLTSVCNGPGALAAPPAAPRPAAELDTQAMIEALMPAATRSMRNLVVRPRVEGAAAGPPAAASGAVAGSSPAASAVAGPASAPVVAAAPVAAPAPASAPARPASAPAGPPPSLALAIQFEANSSRVRPESGPVLGSLVAAMQSAELKGTRFLIEGHADPRGSAAANQRLSQERADEVRLYLVALGVHPARLRAVGRGASRLAKTDEPGAAENRRVRVVTVE